MRLAAAYGRFLKAAIIRYGLAWISLPKLNAMGGLVVNLQTDGACR